jgi:hypothetical protein
MHEHGKFDVLQLRRAERHQVMLHFAPDLLEDGVRDADASRLGQPFEARDDVQAIAVNVTVPRHHIADMDADANADLALWRLSLVVFERDRSRKDQSAVCADAHLIGRDTPHDVVIDHLPDGGLGEAPQGDHRIVRVCLKVHREEDGGPGCECDHSAETFRHEQGKGVPEPDAHAVLHSRRPLPGHCGCEAAKWSGGLSSTAPDSPRVPYLGSTTVSIT